MKQPLADKKILLGVSGSIAAYKALSLCRLLRAGGAQVDVVMTQAAADFVGPASFAALSGRPVSVGGGGWAVAGAQAIAHIALAQHADLVLYAPATAHLIAQLAHGMAGDLLTSLALASAAPQLMAPAMEEGMWAHPATRANVRLLRRRGIELVGPRRGALASGGHGRGRLASPAAIAWSVARRLGPRDMLGRRLLVTAGPTREPIDPARFISNASTGRMGLAIARAALRRGAQVCLVVGPTEQPMPVGAQICRVDTCAQMLAACQAQIGATDALIMAAAPADFRPATAYDRKLGKQIWQEDPQLAVAPTDDILRRLDRPRPAPLMVGFAAETSDWLARGEHKRQAKDLDLLFVNDIGRADRGFAAADNAGWLLGPNRQPQQIDRQPKAVVGELILDRVVEAWAAHQS